MLKISRRAANRWLSDGVYIAEVQPFPDYKAASAAVDRSKPPALGTPPELKLPKLQRATLSNGLKVILAERPGLPLVSFWMTADAGYAADHSAAPGTAKLMSALLVDGTRTRNALQINDQTALLGARLLAYSDLDFSYVQLSALKQKLDPSLELFGDVILNPSFPDADFKREQKLAVGHHPAGAGRTHRNGVARFPRPRLRSDQCLRQSLHSGLEPRRACKKSRATIW